MRVSRKRECADVQEGGSWKSQFIISEFSLGSLKDLRLRTLHRIGPAITTNLSMPISMSLARTIFLIRPAKYMTRSSDEKFQSHGDVMVYSLLRAA
jgi:hypothetical protein